MTQKKLPFERKRSFSVGLTQSQIDFLQDMVDAGLYASVSDCISNTLDIFIKSVEDGQKEREESVMRIMKVLEPLICETIMGAGYLDSVAQHKDEIIPPTSTNKQLVEKDVLQLPTAVVEDEEGQLVRGIISIAQRRRMKPQSVVDEWCDGNQSDFDRVFKGNKAYLNRKLEAEIAKQSQETFVVPRRSLEAERKEAKERHIAEIVQSLPGKLYAYVKANNGDKANILRDEILPDVERIHRYMDKPEREPFTDMLVERVRPIIDATYLTDPEFEYQDAFDVMSLAAQRVTPSGKKSSNLESDMVMSSTMNQRM